MNISLKGINLIKFFEGLELTAYKCSAGVWTIGIGTTIYKDGTKVKKGDIISEAFAIELFQNDIKKFEKQVSSLLTTKVNQNQFDALVSFAYNLGGGALSGSTLLKKINKNPNDGTIIFEFEKWVNAGGVKLEGLVKRRKAEAKHYFDKVN
jgi:lysozyme